MTEQEILELFQSQRFDDEDFRWKWAGYMKLVKYFAYFRAYGYTPESMSIKIEKYFQKHFVEGARLYTDLDKEALLSPLSYLLDSYKKWDSTVRQCFERQIIMFYNDESETVRAEAVRCFPLYRMTYKPLIDIHVGMVHDKSVLVRASILACIIYDFEYGFFEQAESSTFLPTYLDILEVLSQDSEPEVARLARIHKQELELRRQKASEEKENQKEEIDEPEI